MSYVIAAVFFLLWMLGLVTSYTIDGLIHILLFIAVGVLLLRFIGFAKSRRLP